MCCAQARIEELLDDKADLEYEVDVVERKVELLREEVSSRTTVMSLQCPYMSECHSLMTPASSSILACLCSLVPKRVVKISKH